MGNSKWSCDIETDGLDPTVVWCIVVQNVDTKEVITFTPDTVGTFNAWMVEADTLIFHNGIGYDVPVMKKLLGTDFTNTKVEDTLVLSQLDDPRREGGNGLKSWGDRFGYPKGDHEDWSCYSEEMLTYCVRDVEITTKLYHKMMSCGMPKDAIELEYKTKEHCSVQEKKGWYYDEDNAVRL